MSACSRSPTLTPKVCALASADEGSVAVIGAKYPCWSLKLTGLGDALLDWLGPQLAIFSEKKA